MRRVHSVLLAALVTICLPLSAIANNAETAQKIASSLTASGQLKDYSILVKYAGGTAQLVGSVRDERQKATAETIARQSPFVKNVINRLEIGPAGVASAGLKWAKQASLQPENIPAPAQPQGRPIPAAPLGPIPEYIPATGGGVAATRFDQPHLPAYAWPSTAPYPNYASLTYPKQYSPTAWPYIGPFYPYPQVPLGWRSVTLQWDDGWWMLDFKH